MHVPAIYGASWLPLSAPILIIINDPPGCGGFHNAITVISARHGPSLPLQEHGGLQHDPDYRYTPLENSGMSVRLGDSVSPPFSRAGGKLSVTSKRFVAMVPMRSLWISLSDELLEEDNVEKSSVSVESLCSSVQRLREALER